MPNATLTTAQIEALAHRKALRYTHSSDSSNSHTYTFDASTLQEFARALLSAPPASLEMGKAGPSNGALKVAVDLLRQVVGPLEVLDATVEDEDGGAHGEALIDSVKKFIEQFDAITIAATPVAPTGKAGVPSEQGWISVEDRLPPVGEEVFVWTEYVTGKWAAMVDCWDEQHEAPVAWSSATIPIGPGWDSGHSFEAVSHWMAFKPPIDTAIAQAPGGRDGLIEPGGGE